MSININKIYKQISNFNNIKVAVIGDFFIDKYVYGSTKSTSSSSGVPIFKEQKRIITLGGAGNVANNLINLGANVTCFCSIGNDDDGKYIINYLNQNNVNTEGIVLNRCSTNSKTRILVNDKEILRIDEENLNEDELVFAIEKWIKKEFKDLNIIIISDYGLGVCSNRVCKKVISMAEQFGIKVIVDSRSNDIEKFKGVNYIVPNLNEFNKIIIKDNLNLIDDEIKNMYKIIKEYEIKDGIILTKGKEGIVGVRKNENVTVPEHKITVVDTVGAGDTVLALLSLGLNIDLNFKELIYLLNIGGAISVSKKATYALSKEQLCLELLELLKKEDYKNKIVDRSELSNICKLYKKLNKRIVFTNGCFDLVHSGHTEYLYKSKKLGDVLILGLNSDDSVKRLKGDTRPINGQIDRSISLAALEPLDFITIFEEDTPKKLLEELNPHILVKGGDYKKEDLDGIEFVEDVILMEYTENKSTTKIIKKIIDRNS